MYYSGYFRNIDTSTDENGQLFKVVIITNFIDREFNYGGELLLTDSPFQVSYEGEDGNIFKPYKCSSATVGLLQNDYNFNFNTSRGNNVMVMLLKWNGKEESSVKLTNQLQIDNLCYDLEWIGFATPNVYSQAYENYYDSFELECQDALSTLQYFPFKVIEDSNKFPYITFIDLLTNLLSPVYAYKHIYIPDTLKIPTSDDSDLLSYLLIDQRNFFDEDGKPQNSLEVVEELMKFLSLTIIPQGDSLYIIDYNGLKKGFSYYYRYSTLNTFYPFPIDDPFTLEANKVELKDEVIIRKEDFSSTGTNLTLQGITNKYSVKDSLYSYDTITPDLEDISKMEDSTKIEQPRRISEELILGDLQRANGLVLAEIGNRYITDDGCEGFLDDKYIKYVENAISPITGNRAIVKHPDTVDEKLYVFAGVVYNQKFQKIYIRYVGYNNEGSILDNSDLITYWYYPDTIKGNTLEYGDPNENINRAKNWGWLTQASYVGTQLMFYQIEKVEGYEEFNHHPKKLELKPCLVMGLGGTTRNNNLREMLIKKPDKQKMFTIKSKSLSLGSGDYIVLDASMNFDQTKDFIPKDQDEVESNKNSLYILYNTQCCGLVFTTVNGNKYSWDGLKWCEGDGFTFNVELDCTTQEEDPENCKGAFSKSHKFKSIYLGDDYNFKELFNVEGGLVIPCPSAFSEDDVNLGQLEFTFYRFYGLNDWMPFYAVVEDLKMEVITKSDRNLYISSKDDTDTEYTNVLNDTLTPDVNLVEVESKTECNISTWDMKQPNYSSINFYRKANLEKIDKLGEREILRLRHIFNKSTGEVLRAEEHIIQNQVNQYSTPSVNLNLNLHKFPKPYSVYEYSYFKDKKFILDGCELDYVNNSYNINIVEKK